MNRYTATLLLFNSLCASCFSYKTEPEINYIPENFVGKVAILFNQKDGLPKEYASGRRIYRIPQCGILKTIFSRPEQVIYDTKTLEKDVLFVYAGKDGAIRDTLHFEPNTVGWDSVKYTRFYELNKDKIFVMKWVYGGFSIGDSIKYEDVEFYVVDSFKNSNKYKILNVEVVD